MPGVRRLPIAGEDVQKLFATKCIDVVFLPRRYLTLARRKQMRYLFAAVLVSLVLSPATALAHPPQAGSPGQPCRVRKIYVAELGQTDEAERFRRELRRQLTRKRFTPAARAEEAEAVLAGKFSFTGSDRDGQLVFDPAEVRDGSGALLWHSSFYLTRRNRGLSLLSGGDNKDAARKVAAQ